MFAASGAGLTTPAWSQSASLPQFSNPYGGVDTFVASPAAPTPRAPARKKAAKYAAKYAAKHAAKHARAKSAQPGAPEDTAGATAAPPSVDLAAPASRKATKDSPLGFTLKWSAEDDPYENPANSTIPAINQILRDSNQTPTEKGSGVQAGVDLKF